MREKLAKKVEAEMANRMSLEIPLLSDSTQFGASFFRQQTIAQQAVLGLPGVSLDGLQVSAPC
jgi:hypothetical protein